MLITVDTVGKIEAFATADTLGGDESGDACEEKPLAPQSVQA